MASETICQPVGVTYSRIVLSAVLELIPCILTKVRKAYSSERYLSGDGFQAYIIFTVAEEALLGHIFEKVGHAKGFAVLCLAYATCHGIVRVSV